MDNITPTPPNLTSLLIINPNTSTSMTDALKPVLNSLPYPNVRYDFYTSPPTDDTGTPGIPSVNSPSDAARSAKICYPSLKPFIREERYDGYLVACYSAHPLVGMIRDEIRRIACTTTATTDTTDTTDATGATAMTTATSTPTAIKGNGRRRRRKKVYVTGIFESSVLAALASLDVRFSEGREAAAEEEADNVGERFGIVSTGKVWEEALTEAVREFLVGGGGSESRNGKDTTGVTVASTSPLLYTSPRFAGCETTGLNATELHDLPGDVVRRKMKEATIRLLSGRKREADGGDSSSGNNAGDRDRGMVGAICLGCAGMVGLEAAVREGCVEVLGDEKGNGVRIVDGVVAGVGMLVGMVGSGF